MAVVNSPRFLGPDGPGGASRFGSTVDLMTESVLQAQRSLSQTELAANVRQHRDSTWHRVLGRLLVAALTASALIVQVSSSVGALGGTEGTVTAPVRSIDLGSDKFSAVLVSESEQRIVVQGTDSLVLYDLATMQFISNVQFEQSIQSMQLHGDSVYVFEPETLTIVQVRLSDGAVLRRWDTEADIYSLLAASPSYIWYGSYDVVSRKNSLCRIALDDSGTECFVEPERYTFREPFSIDASEETFLIKSQNGWHTRFDLTGSQAVPQTRMRYEVPSGKVLDLEPIESYSLWTLAGGTLVNVSRSTLEPSTIVYGDSGAGRLSVEPLLGQYAALETETRDGGVIVYRSGDATPVALFHPDLRPGQRHESIALTATEGIQLTSTSGNDMLNVYTIPTPVEAETAPGRQVASHEGVRSLVGLGLQDVALLEVFAEQDRLVVGGGDELLIYRLSDLSLVAQHTDMDGVVQATASGQSVFVLARGSAEVVELRLADGAIINRWQVPVYGTTGLAVTAEAAWVSVAQATATTKLGRLDRASGQFELLAIDGAFGTIGTLQGIPGAADVALAAMGSSIEIISLEDAPRTLQTYERSAQYLASGENGSRIYRVEYGKVVVFGPDHDTYRTDDVGVYDRIEVLASDASGSGFAIGTDRGTIKLYRDGSSEPSNRIETWGSVHQLAVSDTELAAVTGELGDLTVTVRSRSWAASNHELQITRLAHGTPLVDPGPISLECRSRELHEVPYGSTRTFSVPPNYRYCNVQPWHVADWTIIAVWANGGWEVQEPGYVRVDLQAVSRILIIDYLLSPLNDDNRFVDQAYLDFTGETPQHPIGRNTAQLLRTNEISEVDLIAYLMYEKAGYESTQAPISRLYRAYFLRNPDLAGHQFWVGRNQEGQDLRSISQFFATSPEFEQRYGSVSDAEFVRLVYQNVMSRVPDDEGRSFWISALSDGLSRGEMMTLFSDTPEFRSRVDADVFVTYLAGVLERRELTAREFSRRMEIYRQQGPAAVVLDILNGQTYFDRFWFEGTSTESISNAMFSQLVNGEATGSAEPLPTLGTGLAEQLLLDVD